MAQNTNPIFTQIPDIVGTIWTPSLTANTNSDGTGTVGTSMIRAFVSDATDGSYVTKMRFTLCASAASTATTATVIRVFYSTTLSGTTTRNDTFLLGEIPIASATADSPTASTVYYEFPLNFAMPPNTAIHWSCHALPAANTYVQCVCFGGDY
jgi:hypothetical protein